MCHPTPMARSTHEGSVDPDEHADPEESASNVLQTHDERFALHIGKTHIQVAREALFWVAVEIDVIEALP